MTDYQLIIPDEGAEAIDSIVPIRQLKRFEYIIEAKNGLFKNGKLYRKGSTIKLDQETATRFIKVKEIRAK